MPAIYDLHEFSPTKIISGEIDPTKVVPIKYQPLPTNSAGMVIVNKNDDLTYLKRLSNLYAVKTKQSKFETVVDTAFTELEPVPPTVIPSSISIVDTSITSTAVQNAQNSTAAAGPGLSL
jgi:hypothetical protein